MPIALVQAAQTNDFNPSANPAGTYTICARTLTCVRARAQKLKGRSAPAHLFADTVGKGVLAYVGSARTSFCIYWAKSPCTAPSHPFTYTVSKEGLAYVGR